MFTAAIQRLIRAMGFLIIRREHAAAGFVAHVPRSAFDLVLLHCFRSPRRLHFIQVGANDGQRADPLTPYLDSEEWSGLMFEPVATNFGDLERRHGTNPRLRLRQMAIDRTAGHRQIHDLDRNTHPDLPDWAYGLASFEHSRVLQAAHQLGLDERAIVTEEITTVTWAEVWRDFGPQRCDVLVLDTEGYDLTLLRSADLARRRPRIIHFEHACVPPDDRLAFYAELLALGYELATDAGDTTAWLPA